jgi:hypothetical protein
MSPSRAQPQQGRPSVDLPEPDSPTMPMVWPRRSDQIVPSTARSISGLARETESRRQIMN